MAKKRIKTHKIEEKPGKFIVAIRIEDPDHYSGYLTEAFAFRTKREARSFQRLCELKEIETIFGSCSSIERIKK